MGPPPRHQSTLAERGVHVARHHWGVFWHFLAGSYRSSTRLFYMMYYLYVFYALLRSSTIFYALLRSSTLFCTALPSSSPLLALPPSYSLLFTPLHSVFCSLLRASLACTHIHSPIFLHASHLFTLVLFFALHSCSCLSTPLL